MLLREKGLSRVLLLLDISEGGGAKWQRNIIVFDRNISLQYADDNNVACIIRNCLCDSARNEMNRSLFVVH